MKNRKLLKAVLEKAINQGYKVNQASFDYLMNLLRKDDETCRSALDYYMDEKKYYDTIFSHDFAKAFWGEEKRSEPLFDDGILDKKHNVNESIWQYHLQQMVLCKEPLKYLEKFCEIKRIF